MEIEYFVKNDYKSSKESFDMWKQLSMDFWKNEIKLNPDKIRFREHEQDELAHYSQQTLDVEYQYPRWRWELQGIANRADYDLKQHQKHSGKKLMYNDPYTNERYILFVPYQMIF